MLGTIFYLPTTQLAFYQGIAAICKMKHDVCLQVIAVVIVRDSTSQGLLFLR